MFRRLFLDLLFMGRRGCASAMGMIEFPSSCSSPKALCNQFIDYYICSRGVFCINHIKLRNFVVITIECSIATVDRGSIMTRIYRWSMMVYSSRQAEFMVTKYDIDEQCWFPQKLILSVIGIHAPCKRRRAMKNPVPFMNSKLRNICLPDITKMADKIMIGKSSVNSKFSNEIESKIYE